VRSIRVKQLRILREWKRGDGYYVRTVGNEVAAEVIGEYIKKQGTEIEHESYEQLKLS